MVRPAVRWVPVVMVAALTLAFGAGSEAAQGGPAASRPVDEPLGARYSLGMTLWHLGHSAETIAQFHEYLKAQGLRPGDVLPKASLQSPSGMVRVLVEPELLGDARLNGWRVNGDCIVSGAGDGGPTTSIPLRVPRAGLYRLWVQYQAAADARGVTSLRIYLAGRESLGPLHQADEIYDMPPQAAGPAWKEMLVDLPAGGLVVKLGHVTRWWHGGGGYAERRIDCLYLTDELWAEPPGPEARQAMRQAGAPDGIQWAATVPLAKEGLPTWRWWQVRPVSWEGAAANPRLFALSRRFQQGILDELAAKEYDEKALPDYRAPERQVVFNETWNLVANPVRARRQIGILQADVARQPLGYHYVWHDVGGNIEKPASAEKQGAWSWKPGELLAGYGNCNGTVATRVPVGAPGTYTMWVLSSSVNLSYTAPWFGKVSVDGKEQLTYHHEGKIPSVWMRMGAVTVDRPGEVRVDFTLDGAGFGTTYRRIHALFLADDPAVVPKGTVRPPWTMEMLRTRAAAAGAGPNDKLLLWLADNPYRRLSQEVWADKTTPGDSWPERPVKGVERVREMLVARDTRQAVQVGLRNLADVPLTLDVQPGPLAGKAGRFANAVTWRVAAFVPFGPDRQQWTPFFLLRRPDITVPPLGTAGVWLTLDTHGVPAGQYEAAVRLLGKGVPAHVVRLKVRVSAVKAEPKRPVLVDGWTQPHEGEAYLRDFIEHGMNVWPGEMSKADRAKWGIRQLRLSLHSPKDAAEAVARWKALGLSYEDYFVGIMDEPGGTTEEALKPFLDVAKAIRSADPKVRICFNPSESAQLATFQVLAPYCDFWCPYTMHVFAPYWGNPEKRAIYTPKPWMWYTTPCLWDKTAGDPGIRQVPSRPGNCVGVAFFALNYPWRDQWDTGYEHIADASTMGAVVSRHGPVATIVWEQIREAKQAADLAMMVRERLGVKTFDEVKDPEMQRLITDGTSEELIRWLEAHAR